MTSGAIRIGIIGAGRIGKVHAQNLSFRIPDATIAAITDTDRAAAHAVAQFCSIPRVAGSAHEIFDDPAIDAVVICSPTDTHAELIVEAARRGKHIFCEKPIALTLPQIDRALDAVAAAGVQLQVGFNRRFDANFARVRKAIAGGEVGRPNLLHIISRDPAPPPIAYIRSSGGIFLDMSIHDFDMARYLIGEEPHEIYSVGTVLVDPEIGKAGDVDTVLTLLRFPSGAIAVIDNSRRATYGYDQRAEVLGELGKIETLNCYPNQAIVSDGQSVRRDLPLNFFMDRYTESFVEEMREFIAALREQRPTLVAGNDGRAAVVMALAAQQSHLERRPVGIQEIGSFERATGLPG